jgi:hypothetical protein
MEDSNLFKAYGGNMTISSAPGIFSLAAVALFLTLFACTNTGPTGEAWAGFFKDVKFAHSSGLLDTFPLETTAPAYVMSGPYGEPPTIGWQHSLIFGPWDSISFVYAYNDSLPSNGQSIICTLQTVASSKVQGFYYKNISIYKKDTDGLTDDTVYAPDSRLVITGIPFDDSVPLLDASLQPVDKSKINARHAIKFVLSWSQNTLSGEFHWAGYTVPASRGIPWGD